MVLDGRPKRIGTAATDFKQTLQSERYRPFVQYRRGLVVRSEQCSRICRRLVGVTEWQDLSLQIERVIAFFPSVGEAEINWGSYNEVSCQLPLVRMVTTRV